MLILIYNRNKLRINVKDLLLFCTHVKTTYCTYTVGGFLRSFCLIQSTINASAITNLSVLSENRVGA